MPKDWSLLLTCEHAGYKIPKHYIGMLNAEQAALLPTHRGWDKGALSLAKQISKVENAPLFFTEISRLLIDCNRSLNHRNCFGPAFRDFDEEVKSQIARDYYHPYRQSVVDTIGRMVKQGERVLHCAFHSFTPVLDGEVRNADLGLLYDPARASEARWADVMIAALSELKFAWPVRRNYPYRGKSDGFTRFLRGEFATEHYAGFEIEVNQRVFVEGESAKSFANELQIFFTKLRHSSTVVDSPSL